MLHEYILFLDVFYHNSFSLLLWSWTSIFYLTLLLIIFNLKKIFLGFYFFPILFYLFGLIFLKIVQTFVVIYFCFV